MIDPANSMNVMRALQGPNNQQQANGGEKAGGQGGLPPQVQQLIDAITKAIGAAMAAAKGGDQKEGQMSEGQRQQTRNAVDGIPNGRLAQERGQMTG